VSVEGAGEDEIAGGKLFCDGRPC